jgi:hypothetical protein
VIQDIRHFDCEINLNFQEIKSRNSYINFNSFSLIKFEKYAEVLNPFCTFIILSHQKVIKLQFSMTTYLSVLVVKFIKENKKN